MRSATIGHEPFECSAGKVLARGKLLGDFVGQFNCDLHRGGLFYCLRFISAISGCGLQRRVEVHRNPWKLPPMLKLIS